MTIFRSQLTESDPVPSEQEDTQYLAYAIKTLCYCVLTLKAEFQ